LSFRYSATTDTKAHDIRHAEALLPSGAVTRFAVGIGDLDELDEELDFDDYDLLPSDVLPPLPILRHADALAFGWYPAVGDSMWKRWVAVVQRGPAVDKAARIAGMRGLGPAPGRTRSGIHFATRDGLLVLGSDASLLGEAMRAALPNKGEETQVVLARGGFVGPAAAAVLAELPHTADLEPGTLRFAAAMVGIIDDVAYEASWNPSSKLGVLEGRLRLRLADDEDRSQVIDQWLAAARVRNAGRLPRSVGREELEGTLVYTLEVADAKAFARQTLFVSPRAKAVVIDDTHVRLTVVAAPPRGKAEPLPASRRKKLLESTDGLRSDDARIVKLSRTLAPAGTAPEAAAAKILTWVHGRIQYEVTPRSLDGVEILEAGRGDCSEYARLTVSLLRAAGVPAEVRDGMAADGDEMVAHAWVGYHDGERWHEIDPTWGRMSVTAGHLPVSVVDILALISLDRLTITRIDAKKQVQKPSEPSK
jgi:transglutaminase-like putative cysteine protease